MFTKDKVVNALKIYFSHILNIWVHLSILNSCVGLFYLIFKMYHVFWDTLCICDFGFFLFWFRGLIARIPGHCLTTYKVKPVRTIFVCVFFSRAIRAVTGSNSRWSLFNTGARWPGG